MPGVAENEPEIKRKKQKKLKGEAEMAAGASTAESEKKKKKRKSDNGTAEENPTKKQKKVSSDEDVPASPSENPYALDNFRISEAVKEKLRSREINALFAIQAQTFDIVFDGDDLVARARTGQGKTLAFVLPIVESLSRAGTPQKKFGRAPSVLILLPTRELAQQVHADIECYGGVVGLKSICVYGKSSYGPQESAMRRGVDIVVGTPGRVKDLLERGDLNLKTLKFRVLDEADEMLKMGFVEPVEYILSAVEDASTVQTLLFSATMPDWVKEIAQKFFKPDKKIVDLVGDEKMKASTSVTHLLMPCSYHARSQIVPDVIKVYGSGGRVIVFTETKNDASELAAALSHIAKALHGDIPQHLREATLAGFRSGKFNVLVATDVAARGLDINDVQLIIQCEPPRDAETYIHRSGRTGRAGNSGVAILLYDRKKEYMVPIIERKAGFKFERISAPQPSAIAKESASSATKGVLEVSDSVLPLFREAAQELVEKSGAPALDLLAKALAKLAGYTEAKRRSLQTSHDDSTTLLFESPKQIFSAGYIFNALRGCLSEELVSEIRRMNLTVDGMGAVFDVPSIRVDEFLKGLEDQNFSVSVAETLPELTPKPEKDNNWGRGGFNGGRGGRSAGNGGGRGRGGYGYGNNNGRRWGK